MKAVQEAVDAKSTIKKAHDEHFDKNNKSWSFTERWHSNHSAIRQVMYYNPSMDLNLNGVSLYHQFHEGKLVVLGCDGNREPDNVPFELTPILPNQSMTPRDTSSCQQNTQATPDNAFENVQESAPPP
ncbi:hypothetical protein RJT34_17404 [Clitoria ternatea]|uniref:Uncharacterized protein n=1 Tax=Clitoria ternatea TaxID=43366 RepID=A0AAN9PD47_CLITE